MRVCDNEGFDRKAFGLALSTARIELDLSVPKLERHMQEVTGWRITPKTIYSYECGQRMPTFSCVINMAKALYGDEWEHGLISLAKAGTGDV